MGQTLLAVDRDLARFHRFRDFASECNGEQSIGERRRNDLDVLSKLEAMFESLAADAAMKIVALSFGAVGALVTRRLGWNERSISASLKPGTAMSMRYSFSPVLITS